MHIPHNLFSYALACATAFPLAAQNEQPPGARPEPSGPTDRQESTAPEMRISIDKDKVVLSVDESDGIGIQDFVRLASTITGKRFSYGQDLTMQSDPHVRFVGIVKIPRDDYFGFFQTMMLQKGFACSTRGEGDSEIVELVSLNGPKRSDLAANARYVASDEIENIADQAGTMIITTIELEHLRANQAVTTLRPFVSRSSQQALSFGSTGSERKLIVQGLVPMVRSVINLVRKLDRPDQDETMSAQLIRLEHVDAVPLASTLAQLANQMRNAPTIIPETQSNSLLLRGSAPQIEAMTSLVRALDKPDTSTANVVEAPKKAATPLTISGGKVTLEMDPDQPVRLADLLQMAHEVTGDVFTLTGDATHHWHETIRVIGTLKVDKDGFRAFFTSLLAAHGFTCERNDGEQGLFVEVRRSK